MKLSKRPEYQLIGERRSGPLSQTGLFTVLKSVIYSGARYRRFDNFGRRIARWPLSLEFDLAEEVGHTHFIVAVLGGLAVAIYVELGKIAATGKLPPCL